VLLLIVVGGVVNAVSYCCVYSSKQEKDASSCYQVQNRNQLKFD